VTRSDYVWPCAATFFIYLIYLNGIGFAKQPLYRLSHTPVHFALVILETGGGRGGGPELCPGWPRTTILLLSATSSTLFYLIFEKPGETEKFAPEARVSLK
jgi:hypothetical protein